MLKETGRPEGEALASSGALVWALAAAGGALKLMAWAALTTTMVCSTATGPA